MSILHSATNVEISYKVAVLKHVLRTLVREIMMEPVIMLKYLNKLNPLVDK